MMKTVKTDLDYWVYLEDNPNFTGILLTKYGHKYWFRNGEHHRTDGPAIEYHNGEKEWLQNGKLHREDGPAIEFADGDKSWHINGEYLTEEEWKIKSRKLKLDKFLL